MDRMLHLGTVVHATLWKLMLAAVFVFAGWPACAAPPRPQGSNLPKRIYEPYRYPIVSLIARTEGSGHVGRELSDPLSSRDNPLRVVAGKRVTLDARVENAHAVSYLSYQWRQRSGPAVQLLRDFHKTRETFTSTQFTAKKPGVILMECRVMVLDAHEIPTGVVIVKLIRVVVLPSPTPAIQTGPVTTNSRRR